jgi:hypothetical protein
MRKILFMPISCDTKIVTAPIEMSNDGFDYENIAKAVLVYILTCIPNGVISVLADMLNEYITYAKYNHLDGGDEYIVHLRGVVKEKLV